MTDDKGPEYRPLTADEFNAGSDPNNGIPFQEDEYGEHVYAYGHIDPETFADAVYAMDVRNCGEFEAARHDPSEVQHTWAWTIRPADHPDGWYAQCGKPEGPDAFPLTVVTR